MNAKGEGTVDNEKNEVIIADYFTVYGMMEQGNSKGIVFVKSLARSNLRKLVS